MPKLTLISHELCPYVQRAAIALHEKGALFERVNVDLANKPDWFLQISPLGKVPLLKVDDAVLFESAAICEYLDETIAPRLHPEDALRRAEHRAWIEFSSAMLGDLWGFYTAADEVAFAAKKKSLHEKMNRLEARLVGPWFDGERFHLIDAVFAPVMRYFPLFDSMGVEDQLVGFPKLRAWKSALLARPSARDAVAPDFEQKFAAAIRGRNSFIAQAKAA